MFMNCWRFDLIQFWPTVRRSPRRLSRAPRGFTGSGFRLANRRRQHRPNSALVRRRSSAPIFENVIFLCGATRCLDKSAPAVRWTASNLVSAEAKLPVMGATILPCLVIPRCSRTERADLNCPIASLKSCSVNYFLVSSLRLICLRSL